LAEAGKRDTVHAKKKRTKCSLVDDSVLCNVGEEHANMKVECFPGIKTEQLNRMAEKWDIGNPETDVIHVGTDVWRTTINLDFVMEIYALVATAKRKFTKPKLVLSGVL
jgi:hypothetical protein